MKSIAVLGIAVGAVGFSLAMQTALTPQNAVAKTQPVPAVKADSSTKSGGCCAKKAAPAAAECDHSKSTGGCGGHPAESAPSGCTRNETGKASELSE